MEEVEVVQKEVKNEEKPMVQTKSILSKLEKQVKDESVSSTSFGSENLGNKRVKFNEDIKFAQYEKV